MCLLRAYHDTVKVSRRNKTKYKQQILGRSIIISPDVNIVQEFKGWDVCHKRKTFLSSGLPEGSKLQQARIILRSSTSLPDVAPVSGRPQSVVDPRLPPSRYPR
ncbi:hypothetical protein RRG08_009120 [Elysia crispata]|uniref:Uncharacterized protein n=1 Tax=Elysia crispata TaxID=231223 RepID=A0AAE0YNW5_9GAST|nr:hypothetical protein RRG08_009120 [Elysia crispata]